MIRRHFERELIDKALVVFIGLVQRHANAGLAMCIDIQELRRDVVDFFGGAALRFVPLVGAEPMQRGMFFVGAAIAADQIQCRDGDVELGLVGIFDG